MLIISSQLLLQREPARPIKGEQNLQASFQLQGPLTSVLEGLQLFWHQ